MIKKLRPSFSSQDTMKTLKNNWVHILIVVLLVVILALVIAYQVDPTFKKTVTNTFANISKKTDVSKQVKELDIVFFMKPECPHCKTMISIFTKEGTLNSFKIVDVSKDETLANQFGVDGFPTFVSITLKTGVKGARSSTKEIVNELINTAKGTEVKKGNLRSEKNEKNEKNTGNEVLDFLKNLNIIMFKSTSCPHCVRMMKELAEHGAISEEQSIIKYVEASSPEAKDLMMTYKLTSQGVPFFYSVATGKTVVGSSSFNDFVGKWK